MCDLAYLNLLREKVRQTQAEDRRIAALGLAPRGRFVPIRPAPLQEDARKSD